MTQPNPAKVPPFDGSSGNLISRAEPKVRAAGLTSLLAPIALYYLYEYVPGLKELPTPLTALVAALVIGALTFAAGFAARAVDRVDLFARGELAQLEPEVSAAAKHAFGEKLVDDVERYVHELHDEVVPPVRAAAHAAVEEFEHLVGAGTDPIRAAEIAVQPAEQVVATALQTAIDDGRAEVPTLVADAASAPVAQTAEMQAVTAVVQANPALADLLHKALALLEPAAGSETSPIHDAVAAEVPAAVPSLPPVPAPAPPTTPMAAVNPATAVAPA